MPFSGAAGSVKALFMWAADRGGQPADCSFVKRCQERCYQEEMYRESVGAGILLAAAREVEEGGRKRRPETNPDPFFSPTPFFLESICSTAKDCVAYAT